MTEQSEREAIVAMLDLEIECIGEPNSLWCEAQLVAFKVMRDKIAAGDHLKGNSDDR